MSKIPEANIESVPFDKPVSAGENLSSELSKSDLDSVKATKDTSSDGSVKSTVGDVTVTQAQPSQESLKIVSPYQSQADIPSLAFLNSNQSPEDRKINDELNGSLDLNFRPIKTKSGSVASDHSAKPGTQSKGPVETATTVQLNDGASQSQTESDPGNLGIPDIDINFFKDYSQGSWTDILNGKRARVIEEGTNTPKNDSIKIDTEKSNKSASIESTVRSVSQQSKPSDSTNIEDNQLTSRSENIPTVRLDQGQTTSESQLERLSLDSNSISRSDNGKIDKIDYIDKTRNFKWQGDELVGYTEIGSKGTSEFSKDSQTGKWAVEVGGIKVELPGGVELDNKSGTFKIQMAQEGKWKFESPAGQISMESKTKDGARVVHDENNRLEKITRKDGSTIEPIYKNGEVSSYVENSGAGNETVWTKQGDEWVSSNKSSDIRKNFSVNDQGTTKFETKEGLEHTIKGSGAEIIEGEGRAKLTVDDLGRVTKVEYANDPNGRVREVEYFGDSRDVKRFSVTLDGVTHDQTRTSKESREWTSSTSKYRNFKGDARMDDDGTFALKRQEDNGTWDTRWTDNTGTVDRIDSHGTRASFDDNGNIVRYKNENGAVAKAEYSSGQQTSISIKNELGERATWTKSSDGTWASDSSNEVRKNMTLQKNGDCSFETLDGVKHTERIDGHTEIQNQDGSRSEFDKEGQLLKVRQKDGAYRTFEYNESGELQSAFDMRRSEKRTVFERRNNESRNDITLSKEGKISFETASGEKVEKFANGNELVRNSKDNIVKVRTGDGKSREFEYDKSGERLEKIIDSRVNSKGEISRQVLTRQSVAEGVVGDIFVGKSHKGKDIVRKDVSLNDDGTYTFRNLKEASDSKPRFAQIGGNDSSLAAWDATINRDVLDRVTDVVNGTKERHYEYFNDSQDIQKLTVKKDGKVHTWERDSAQSDRWYKLNDDGSRPANAWRGQVQVTSNGIHMYRASDHYGRYANSWNSTFPDGTQTKGSLTSEGTLLFKDDSNKLKGALLKDGSSISVVSKDGANRMTVFNAQTEEATTWTEKSDNKWDSDSPTATDTRANLRFDDKGALHFEDSKGRTNIKELDGRRFVKLKGGVNLGYDSQGQLEHVQRRGKVRTFNRENGEITSVTDKDSKGEVRTIFQSKGASDTRTKLAVNDNGDFSFESKAGIRTVLKSNGITESRDSSGNLLKVERENGATREFKYTAVDGGEKVVSHITDSRPTSKGVPRVSTWTRNIVNGVASNQWSSVTDKGHQRAPRKDIKVLEDGNFEYKMVNDSASDKPRIARLSGGDGTYMSESVEDGHYNLLDAMESHMEKPRVVRMEKMMKQFESRMADQYELMTAAGIPEEQARQQLDDAMTKTYDHMTRLITTPDGQGQFNNQRQRMFLAENFMYHAADPTTIEQGNTGTCWWESSYAVGMERNTNHLARFVTDIALTGQYKSTAGKPDRYGNITEALHKMFSPRYGTVDLRNSQNGFEFANGWSIETADRDSTRSPVSKMIDNYGPAVLGWRGQGRPNSGGHGEAWRILYMMTGRKVVNHGSSRLGRNERIKLLREGGYTASGGGHMWGYCMRKVGDEWHVIRNDQYQNRDRVIARVRNLQDWIDNGTRDNVRKTWRPYSPTNPDQQPYKVDDIRDENNPDRPNRPFRPIIRRFFRPFRFRRR